MVWIDGEYFEPLMYGSFIEQHMIASWEFEKFKQVLSNEFWMAMSDAIVAMRRAFFMTANEAQK